MAEVTLVLALLVAVIVLVTIARMISVPYPIFLVIGGLVLGLALALDSRAPALQLQPDLVFVLFLPPLLYQDAFNLSLRDFRANLPSITLLATGLVLATTCIVAVVVHWATAHTAVPLSWPLCFTLGAIVSPTDAVAATTIFQRLRVPRRLEAVLEGESLINDAMAIILYSTALDLAVHDGTHFSLGSTAARFIVVGVASVALGLVTGWAIGELRRRLHDPPVESTISLLTGFAAYLPAYALGLSGVLAVVAAGIYLGRLGPHYISSRTRLQAQEMWAVVVFLLNGLIFILIGLQLRPILARLTPGLIVTFILVTLAASLTVVVVRMAWIFPSARVARLLTPVRMRQPAASWKVIVIAGWAGMGGVVSLAAALALPEPATAHTTGYTAQARDLVVFATFGVILVTLVGKGLSLPWLIRRLDLPADDGAAREETKARYKASQAALARLEEIATEDWASPTKLEQLRARYQHRSHVLRAAIDGHDEEDHDHEAEATSYRRLRGELLAEEHRTVVDLRDRGVINDEVLHRLQREIDLEEVQLSSE